MKYFRFFRESNNFDDILKDINIKKYTNEVVVWKNYCMIGIQERFDDKVCSYIILKYGDSLINSLTNDYSPLPNIDYIPKR